MITKVMLTIGSHFKDKILNEILNALFAIAYADKSLHHNGENMLIEILKFLELIKRI